jgi:hypothetical protein
MTQDTYRFAYDEACAELREILGQFNQLRARKDQMEQVVEALRPLLSDVPSDEVAPSQPAVETAPFLVQQVADVSPDPTFAVTPEAVSEAAEVESSSDPFQRRIDNALRHGFGSRESKVMPRALNGLLSRA